MAEFKTEEKAVLLLDKQAKLICARKKKEIILTELSQAHIGKPIFLCGERVYGIIELNEPQGIDDTQFKNRYKRHLLTIEEKEEIWPNNSKYYAYSFRIKRIFKESIDYIKEEDIIGFMKAIKFNLDINKKNEDKIEKDFSKYYNEIEELEKLVAIEGYDDIKRTLLKLYKLLLNKMELKSRHGNRRRCTASDRRAGRCSPGQIYRHSKFDNYDDETGFIKAPKVDITDKNIRIRLREPSTIVKDSFRTITLSESKAIKAVIGRLKTDPDGPTHVQSVLFDKDKWNTEDALAWVNENSDSLKSAIEEGKKSEKSLLDYKTIICNFCERDFKYKDNGMSGVYAKCPYCEKVDYYS